MELLFADVNPGVKRAEVQVRIAGETQSSNVKQRCHVLIGYSHIHMFEQRDVAHVLGGSIKLRLSQRSNTLQWNTADAEDYTEKRWISVK